MLVERESNEDVKLEEILAKLNQDTLDLVLVEGFKRAPYTKIELRRSALKAPYLYPEDPNIIAVASDAPLKEDPGLPMLDINDPAEIAAFIAAHVSALS